MGRRPRSGAGWACAPSRSLRMRAGRTCADVRKASVPNIHTRCVTGRTIIPLTKGNGCRGRAKQQTRCTWVETPRSKAVTPPSVHAGPAPSVAAVLACDCCGRRRLVPSPLPLMSPTTTSAAAAASTSAAALKAPANLKVRCPAPHDPWKRNTDGARAGRRRHPRHLQRGVLIGSSFVFKKRGLLASQKGHAAGEGVAYLKSVSRDRPTFCRPPIRPPLCGEARAVCAETAAVGGCGIALARAIPLLHLPASSPVACSRSFSFAASMVAGNDQCVLYLARSFPLTVSQ
jgi:hypothetical protein